MFLVITHLITRLMLCWLMAATQVTICRSDLSVQTDCIYIATDIISTSIFQLPV